MIKGRYIILFILFSFCTVYTKRNIHLVIESRLAAGFFAEMHTLLDRIAFYEHDNLEKVTVQWTQQFFPYKDKPNENGWDLYFEPIEIERTNDEPLLIARHNSAGHELHDQTCPNPWLYPGIHLPYREWIHQKIKKYIKIKPHILEKVNDFYEAHMAGHICIGVHVRYCAAHGKEVPGGRVPTLEEYFFEVDRLMKELKDQKIKIYVASDSHAAIRAFKERYGDKLVYIDAFRANYREDPHLIDINTSYWVRNPDQFHAQKPGYQGGLETLMDVLLLSHCDYLFMTVSNFGKFASYLNPHIKLALLPRSVKPLECSYKRNRSLRAGVRNQWHLDLS